MSCLLAWPASLLSPSSGGSEDVKGRELSSTACSKRSVSVHLNICLLQEGLTWVS